MQRGKAYRQDLRKFHNDALMKALIETAGINILRF
jgi:hypothetical protein